MHLKGEWVSPEVEVTTEQIECFVDVPASSREASIVLRPETICTELDGVGGVGDVSPRIRGGSVIVPFDDEVLPYGVGADVCYD